MLKMIFYIRHRAFRRAGRVRVICLLSDVWFSCLLRGPHAPHPFLPVLTCITRFSHFLHHFFKPHFLRELVPKGLKMGAPKQPKITKIYKKSSSKRIRNQGLQKDSVWKGSNLWNWRQLYTFNTFYKGQGIPKVRQNGSQNGAPGHPKSQKTRKASAQKNTEKTTLPKVGQ